MAEGKLFDDGKDDKKKEKPKVTVGGYHFSDVVSALQKAIRRGMEKEAVFWAYELIDTDAIGYLWRRLITIASEDIGLADPMVAVQVGALAQNYSKAWGEVCVIVQAILIMCRSVKNRECDNLAELIRMYREKEGMKLELPLEAKDMHCAAGGPRIKELMAKTGKGYQKVTDELFYTEGAVLDKPVEEGGNIYTKELLEYLGIEYRGF